MTRKERLALTEAFRPQLRKVERRLMLKSSLSLGALTLLTGCDLADGDVTDRVLWAMLRFNDRVQALLFNPVVLAKTFPPSRITKPFRFNAFYDEDSVPDVDGGAWKMAVSGLVTEADPATWTPELLRPYFDVVLDSFGPERLMIGTDWPVCTIGSSYSQWWHIVEGWTASLSPFEQAAILGETATRVYRLNGASSR